MIEEINRIETSILTPTGLVISTIILDKEAEDYSGYNFHIGQFSIKFRKARITPKKIGQFVTLWKRGFNGQTQPFDTKDNFDFYIIAMEDGANHGFFLFPKQLLSSKQILTSGNLIGKRGFRVYADWDFSGNKPAEKAKKWQTDYFINLTKCESHIIEKFKSIVNLT